MLLFQVGIWTIIYYQQIAYNFIAFIKVENQRQENYFKTRISHVFNILASKTRNLELKWILYEMKAKCG